MHGNQGFSAWAILRQVWRAIDFLSVLFDVKCKKVRLEHGDALCSDDKGYQRFRKIINILSLKIFARATIKKRQQIAQDLRQKKAKLIMPKISANHGC